MKLAFTGRRDRLTAAQGLRVAAFLDSQRTTFLLDPSTGSAIDAVGHNGGEGADLVFHEMATKRELPVVHPGEGLSPMPANRALVTWCDVLIGCPPTNHLLKKNSGTWATILYGFKYDKKVHIYLPDGRAITERSEIPKS